MKYQKISDQHLIKAQESALLAIEFYNKPAVKFKTGGYIVMMSIAWTSLFHAIFFKRKTKPFYKDSRGRYEKREGDFRYWELATCIREYFGSDENPIKSNLNFFIPLRNRIEHRSMPELDPTIFGECQSLLMNFDSIIESEFGPENALKESLSFALQLFPKTIALNLESPKPAEKDLVDFINSYRSALSADVFSDSRYAFKAFLIKVSNHNTKDSTPVKFINYEMLSEEERDAVTKLGVLIKSKEVAVANANLFKPKDVVLEVQKKLGNPKIIRHNGFDRKHGKKIDRFNQGIHALLWKKYRARPDGNSSHPESTKKEWCVYDSLNKNYGYTQAWIDFVVGKIRDDIEFLSLLKNTSNIEIIPIQQQHVT